MSVSVITGLLIQGSAAWLMHVGVRGRWLSHIGAVFLAVAVSYHGVTEIMQWLWPGGRNSYRKLIGQGPLDDWVLAVSVALLLYTIAYVFALRHRQAPPDPPEPARYFHGLSIKWLLIAVAPLILLTATGSRSASVNTDGSPLTGASYVVGGLVEQYLIPLAGITAAAVIAAKGPKWILPTLGVQAALLALGGDRRSILFGCVITLYSLSIAQVKLPRKTMAVGLTVAVLLVLSISASRAILGRQSFYASQGAATRSSAILAGSDALNSSAAWSGIRDETVDRLDGNTFGALLNLQMHDGVPSVGYTTIVNDLRLNIPSFLYPGKNAASLEDRDEEVYLQQHFALSVDNDFIPGLFGTVVGYYGLGGVMLSALLIGLLLAYLDLFVLRRPSPARLVLGAGLILSVLLYEQGPPGLLTLARGAAAMSVAVWAQRRISERRATGPVRSR